VGKEEFRVADIALIFIFVILNLLVVIFAYLATITDPSDPLVKQERFSRITKQTFPEDDFELFC